LILVYGFTITLNRSIYTLRILGFFTHNLYYVKLKIGIQHPFIRKKRLSIRDYLPTARLYIYACKCKLWGLTLGSEEGFFLSRTTYLPKDLEILVKFSNDSLDAYPNLLFLIENIL